MTRMPSSRATMPAGTSPPRVTATIAEKPPTAESRQASARASRWKASQETGKAFSSGRFEIGPPSGVRSAFHWR